MAKLQKQKIGMALAICLFITAMILLLLVLTIKDSSPGHRGLISERFLVIDRNSFMIMIFSLIIGGVILYFLFLFFKQREIKRITQAVQELVAQDGPRLTGNAALDQELLHVKKNITDNERLLMMETQRTKDLIIYLAHDLKTPLASVIGYLNLLTDLSDLPLAQQKKFTQISLEKAERLESLIDEFFDIARFSLYDIVLYKQELDVAMLIQQMIDEFYPLLQQKHQHLMYQGPTSLIVTADGEKLARVLNNLLKNAAAYGNPDTTILIELGVQAQEMVLTITNEGVTIPEDQLNMIFEKFYRLDQSRSTQTGGAGLGLAIAKEIIEAHHGTITAVSQDFRTSFTLILPLS